MKRSSLMKRIVLSLTLAAMPAFAQRGKVDVLLVTHAHPDHILDAPAIAKLNNIPLWDAGDLNMALKPGEKTEF